MSDDPRHKYTCDWNLYPEQRPDPELCNLGCLDDPEMVKRDRAYVDAQSDGSQISEAGPSVDVVGGNPGIPETLASEQQFDSPDDAGRLGS